MPGPNPFESEDEETVRKFLEGGKDTVKFEKPKDADEAKAEADKVAYLNREGERTERLAQEAAAKKNAQAQKDAEEAAYQEDRGSFGVGPVAAWLKKQAGSYKPQTPEQNQNNSAFRSWLAGKQKAGQQFADSIIPQDIANALRSSPMMDSQHYYADGTPRLPVRQPVSFQRDVSPGVATSDEDKKTGILPLYEPEGKQLHMSESGHAFLANAPTEDDGRPSLSGSSMPEHLKKALSSPATSSAPAKAKAKKKEPTPDELMRMAELMEKDMRETHEARMAQGPSVQAKGAENPGDAPVYASPGYTKKNIVPLDFIPDTPDLEKDQQISNLINHQGPGNRGDAILENRRQRMAEIVKQRQLDAERLARENAGYNFTRKPTAAPEFQDFSNAGDAYDPTYGDMNYTKIENGPVQDYNTGLNRLFKNGKFNERNNYAVRNSGGFGPGIDSPTQDTSYGGQPTSGKPKVTPEQFSTMGLPSNPNTNAVGFSKSDEKDKTSIAPQTNELDQLLEHLKPYSFDYKNPSAPGQSPGRKIGIMAQDLEKSPVGAQAVVDTPDGKMVDFGKLIPVTLAAAAKDHDENKKRDLRLERLEAALSGLA